MEVLQVPEKFRPRSVLIYPPHQIGPGLETEIANRLIAQKDLIQTNLIYCPINWTAYYCNNGFGSAESKREMQEYINSLPKEKYFTVVQYDDGIMVDFPNCVVFAAGGKPDDAIPIPLLCDPHPVKQGLKKDIPISLVANLNTHPIRQEIAKAMYGKEYCYIGKHDSEKYAEIIQRSYFTVCPRGYGKTSFRMYEAIQLGTIPVYVSDEFWLPYQGKCVDWYTFCPMSTGKGFEEVLRCLYGILQDKTEYDAMYKEMDFFSRFMSYGYVAEHIKKWVIDYESL